MKPLHVRDFPVLFFKNECNKIEMEKTVLDCGAGGRRPPLALFYKDGYKTAGIEILDSQIERATSYEKENDM
ncbi:MAG: class I SAM-dependent methyltransferase, partial [Candidatus Heimdallarchaeota archaeon]